jgi:UDP-glucose 4-epimerase
MIGALWGKGKRDRSGMTTHLVTGGAGFIGSHIVEALVSRGESVRVLDNLTTGRLENLHGVKEEVEFIEGDLRDLATVRRVMEGIEYVFHHAALASVPLSVEDPLTTHAVNATGTLNILFAARDAGVRRVVYASSSSVYGDRPELPKHEEMSLSPCSPYAVSKLAGEELCRAFWPIYGLSTVSLRYFNVFGPRQDPDSPYAAVIPKFVACLKEGEPLPVYGDGRQTRDFIHVSSIVEANLRAAERAGIDGEVFNVGSGKPVSLLDLIAILGEVCGCQPEVRFLPARAGDVRESWANIDKARRMLDLDPSPLQEGLREVMGNK